MKYFKIENYAMKCRLYPNKSQARDLDKMIHAVHVIHNMIIHDWKNGINVIEKEDKNNVGSFIHFPDFSKPFKKEGLDIYRSQNEIISLVPASALSSSKCGLIADMKKALEKTGNHPIERWGEKYTNKNGEEIVKGIKYYSKKNPRGSFSYQITVSNIFPTDNFNVLKINISSRNLKIPNVKIRGWNKNIRFDESCTMNFIDWISIYGKDRIIITIKKDNCGDYWIVFKLSDVYKPMNISDERRDYVGIDVGEITLATLSNGTKYENIFDYTKKFNDSIADEYKTLEYYNTKLSRSEGWKNIDFRNRHKKKQVENVSKTYQRYDNKHKKLNRKIVNQRRDYYNKVTAQIICSNDNIGIEGLSVRDMQWNKDKTKNKKV